MIVSCIVAIGRNNEIGVDQDLPWRLPGDLKYFKEKTLGHHILMGRKNFESIGRALPGRTSIVITRNKSWYSSDVHIVHSIIEGISLAKDRGEEELFIIGGGNIYTQSIGLWDRLYLTEVDTEVPEANVFFPKIDYSKWNIISETSHQADEKNKFDYCFKYFEKKFK